MAYNPDHQPRIITNTLSRLGGKVLDKVIETANPFRMPAELLAGNERNPFIASDGSHKRALFIDSAEGTTYFQGFSAQSDPEAEARLQAKLDELRKTGPVSGGAEG